FFTLSQFKLCAHRSNLFAPIFNSTCDLVIASPQIDAVDRVILMAGIEIVRGSLFVGVSPAMVKEQPRFFRAFVQCCYLIDGKSDSRLTRYQSLRWCHFRSGVLMLT